VRRFTGIAKCAVTAWNQNIFVACAVEMVGFKILLIWNKADAFEQPF
jgi:hypothetical protein